MATKRKTARKKVDKPRNAGTMSEVQFFQWIRQVLRKASIYWKPISQVRKEAQVPYKGPNKRQKFEYECNSCHKWFPDKKINVDHIVGAGSLNCSNDLPGFVDRLFCEQDNLQVLCETCHDAKTKLEKLK